MSGGFFRGTSADQDTRFSNKQAKLLKSQKFAPELDHLVDMTKVKMDVIRPWIATRATELVGFEDEVLINFVYGLLDGKEVDAKQIQIQLTGFMEKNTGKFMKELWSLLLSAQNNVSGVPQQFLDAKEEETRKKKAETDRIVQEIEKRKDRDGREPERGRKSRFDGEADSKFTTTASDSVSKFSKPRSSSGQPEEDREVDGRHGSRVKNGLSKSPPPKDRSLSPPRIVHSPTRSNSKSITRSMSYSNERHKSRSLSVSSQSPRHSVSPRRRYQSPERRSVSPKRRYTSPPRRSVSPRRRRSISPRRRPSPRGARSPSRRRSPPLRRMSRSRHRSPSPFRYRSPLSRKRFLRRRSPSPRRRSPSPHRRRSPLRRRSPPRRSPSPPLRHRPPPSPLSRRRSPSPLSRQRSPIKSRRRSPLPIWQRSPVRQKSLSPARGGSLSPLRRRSPPTRSPRHRRSSPLHSPKRRPADPSISPPQRKRSPSPDGSQSPSHQTRRSLSREHDTRANGNECRRYRDEQTFRRADAKKSPTNYSPERDFSERPVSKHKVPENASHKVPISLRSPQRDIENRSGDHKKRPVASRENSLNDSESPTDMRKVNPRTSRRSHSLSKSPDRQTNNQISWHESPKTSKEEKYMSRAREVSRHKTDSRKRSKDSARDESPVSYSPDRREFSPSLAAHGHLLHSELKKDSRQGSDVCLPERNVQQLPNSSEELEYAPGRAREERNPRGHSHDRQRSAKLLKRDASLDIMKFNKQAGDNERKHQQGGDEYDELHRGTESNTKSKKKMDKKSWRDTRRSDSEDTSSYRNEIMEKRRHKKSDKRKKDYDEASESDSIDEKKEAKRRKKDEKRLRKEEKRRRREERHRRKLERRAGKMKVKSIDTVSPPSDFEMDQGDGGDSDAGGSTRKNSHPSDVDETESERKRLEIELREKALESLRAKKAISH